MVNRECKFNISEIFEDVGIKLGKLSYQVMYENNPQKLYYLHVRITNKVVYDCAEHS